MKHFSKGDFHLIGQNSQRKYYRIYTRMGILIFGTFSKGTMLDN